MEKTTTIHEKLLNEIRVRLLSFIWLFSHFHFLESFPKAFKSSPTFLSFFSSQFFPFAPFRQSSYLPFTFHFPSFTFPFPLIPFIPLPFFPVSLLFPPLYHFFSSHFPFFPSNRTAH